MIGYFIDIRYQHPVQIILKNDETTRIIGHHQRTSTELKYQINVVITLADDRKIKGIQPETISLCEYFCIERKFYKIIQKQGILQKIPDNIRRPSEIRGTCSV